MQQSRILIQFDCIRFELIVLIQFQSNQIGHRKTFILDVLRVLDEEACAFDKFDSKPKRN